MPLYYKFPAHCSNSPAKIAAKLVNGWVDGSELGRTYVLNPIIDHVTIVLRKTSPALNTPGFGTSPDEFWKDTTGFIQGYQNDYPESGVKGITASRPYTVGIQVPLGGNKAILNVFAKPTGNAGPVRFEFNPQRFDAESPMRILEWWQKLTLGQVQLIALLKDATVSRVDVAVDVLNLPFYDLVVTSEKTKRTQTYGAGKSSVETLQFFTSKDSKKRSVLQVYDKRRQTLAVDRNPKWGDLPHTRVEATRAATTAKWRNLPDMEFPFAGFQFRRIKKHDDVELRALRSYADSGRFRGWENVDEATPDVSIRIQCCPPFRAQC